MADDLTRPGTPATFPTQVDEALRRARAADQAAVPANLDDQPIPFALTLDAYAALNRDDRFTNIFTSYQRRVRAYILLRLRRLDHHLADDLTQETFLRALRDLDTTRRDDDRLFSWLAAIARHVICDHYRLFRNCREVTHDTSGADWADSNLTPAASGTYAVIRTGFRTARIGGAW